MPGESWVFDSIDWDHLQSLQPNTLYISIVLIYAVKFNNNASMTQITVLCDLRVLLIMFAGTIV